MLVLLLYDRPIVGVYEVLALRYWPQQFVPLSEWMVEQNLRRAMNLQSTTVKASLMRSLTS